MKKIPIRAFPPLKKYLCCCGFVLLALRMQAQTYVNQPMTGTPVAGSYYNNTGIVVVSPFSFTPPAGKGMQIGVQQDCQPLPTTFSTNQNYILTLTPRDTTTNVAGLGTCQLMQTVQYFDGLGRPMQNVQVMASPQDKDIITPFSYDGYGREVKKYAPYGDETAAANGSFRTTTFADQSTFYSPTASNPASGVVRTSFPFNQSNIEFSPLNRPLEQGAEGSAWQPGTGHTVKISWGNNDAASLSTGTCRWARYFTATVNSNGSRNLVDMGAYTPQNLLVSISSDENWISGKTGTVEDYTDRKGHLVLKRRWYNEVTAYSTYYVYDDFGNLCFVLPPGALPDVGLNSSGSTNQNILNNYCYQYGYDYRNRMITKKLPGKGVEEMVYNLIDQVVYTRDANDIGPQEWKFAKYDQQGRLIITGIEKLNNRTRASLQGQVTDSLTAGILTQWETPSPGSGIQGYTNNAFPNSANVVPLLINYYDDYSFTGQPSTFTSPTGASPLTLGLLTATKKAVLNTINNTTPDMLWTVLYYDDLSRLTQSYTQHYLGGVLSVYNYDVITNTYDFTNTIITTSRNHYDLNTYTSSALLKVSTSNSYIYDHMGRKKQTLESINGGSNVVLSQLDYNEIGQLMKKHLHSTNGGSSFLQDISYTYNERGWMLKDSAALFQMQLQYNKNTIVSINPKPQFNGNIASQSWGNSSSSNSKSFTYQYDALNRITSGVSTDHYAEQGIMYDPMGNITALNRYRAGTLIDSLTYSYNGTNQVQSINDKSPDNNPIGYRPGNYSGYQYDANGNMQTLQTPPDGTAASNINIQYNLLNLPQSISGGRTISYTYDVTGGKLRRVSPKTGSTDYIDGIQYDQAINANSPTLSFIQTEEGKAVPLTSGGYDYYYYLGDNLGNTRVVFDTNTGITAVLQKDDYYPFGMEILRDTLKGLKNEYLYNKKELQEELGQYDYGARFYDPVICRWASIDPLAEGNRRWSPYNYVENDPIRMTDPDGMWSLDANGHLYDSYYDQGSLCVGCKDSKKKKPKKKPETSKAKRDATATVSKVPKIIPKLGLYITPQGEFREWPMTEAEKAEFSQHAQNMQSAAMIIMGFAGPEESISTTGIPATDWTTLSTAPLVGELANQIDYTFGNGTVKGVEVGFDTEFGSGDRDISLENVNIEVKSGVNMKMKQTLKNARVSEAEGKGYYLYMPKATPNQVREAASQGIIVIRSVPQLLRVIALKK